MRRIERWLPRMAAAVAASGLAASSLSGPGPPTPTPATTSHYMVLPASAGAAERVGWSTGCADAGGEVPGPRVLFFGAQEAGGRIRPPGTTTASPAARVGEDAVERAAAGWIRGYTSCGAASAVLALAVNNKSGAGVDGAQAGAAWAALVERVAAAAPDARVVVAGGLDGEPGWGGPGWARDWVDRYVAATRRTLHAAGSADGCPTEARPDASGGRCLNGWTVADVHHVSTGAADTVVALPQIYRTDGSQAHQWAWVSQWGVRSGAGPLRVAGALSQRRACEQRGGCARTDNPPSVARAQLADALAADPATRVDQPLRGTDVAWPDDAPDRPVNRPELAADLNWLAGRRRGRRRPASGRRPTSGHSRPRRGEPDHVWSRNGRPGGCSTGDGALHRGRTRCRRPDHRPGP